VRISVPGFIGAFLTYLFLSIGSDPKYFWAVEEIIAGVIGALLVSIFIGSIMPAIKRRPSLTSPVRWAYAIAYLPILFWQMLKANLDVAYRVITRKINPGIVKINPGYKSDLALAVLANSITLTPGTLSVDVNEKTNELYVHVLTVKDDILKECKKKKRCRPELVSGRFPIWVRRFAE